MKRPSMPKAHGSARSQMRAIRITDHTGNATKSTAITIDKTTGKLAGIETTNTSKAKGRPITPQFATSVKTDIEKAK